MPLPLTKHGHWYYFPMPFQWLNPGPSTSMDFQLWCGGRVAGATLSTLWPQTTTTASCIQVQSLQPPLKMTDIDDLAVETTTHPTTFLFILVY